MSASYPLEKARRSLRYALYSLRLSESSSQEDDCPVDVAVGIAHFTGNPHDSKTMAQVAHWIGRRYARVLVDKGYRGHGQVGNSAVMVPGKEAHAS